MNTDSRNERNDVSSDRIKEQLRALSAVEPPRGLKERLRAGIPCQPGNRASSGHVRGWPRLTGWAGIAATLIVFCGVLRFWTPAEPSVGPEPDATDTLGVVLAVDYNSSLGQVPAVDYNSVRPADINALDSNGLR